MAAPLPSRVVLVKLEAAAVPDTQSKTADSNSNPTNRYQCLGNSQAYQRGIEPEGEAACHLTSALMICNL